MHLLESERQEKLIKKIFISALSKTPNASLIEVLHKIYQDKMMVLATVRTSKIFTPDRVMKMQKEIAKILDMPTELVVRNSLSKDVSATGSTSAVTDPTLDGEFISDKLNADMVALHLADQGLGEILANRPQVRLLNVDIEHIAGDTVILASVQSQRHIIPAEIKQIEEVLQRRLANPTLKLVIRYQVATDMTSNGRILYGASHFGPQPKGVDAVDREMRKALKTSGKFHVTNLDAIWTGKHWSVRAEIYGHRVITPEEVETVQQHVASRVGKPVKLNALSKSELLVMDNRSMAEEEFTIEHVKKKIGPFPVHVKTK